MYVYSDAKSLRGMDDVLLENVFHIFLNYISVFSLC